MFHLYIGTDPTDWVVRQDVDVSALAQELAQATAPVTLPVAFPLQGNLVLSARAAGAVLLAPPGAHGSHPTGVTLQAPLIRVPSSAAATVANPGYWLPPGTDLSRLEQDIIAAMTAGTSLTVQISGVPDAVLVLNGATLAYAVLCQAAPTA